MNLKLTKNGRIDRYFLRILFMVFLPTAVLIITLVCSMISNNRKSLEYTQNSYHAKLQYLCSTNEDEIINTISTINILLSNHTFGSVSEEGSVFISPDIAQTLTRIKENNHLLDNIFIYERTGNIVYTDAGTYNPIIFFGSFYSYSGYPRIFWEEYTDFDENARILFPEFVSTYNSSKTVIPIVFGGFDSLGSNTMIVANIDLTEIISEANASKLTKNSVLALMNKENKNIFFESYESPIKLDDNFFSNIQDENKTAFMHHYNNKKCLVVSYSAEELLTGYSYFAIIPYQDIVDYTTGEILFAIFLVILGSLGLLALSLFSSKQIYKPIENIFDIFKNYNYTTNDNEQDSVQDLQNNIHNILDTVQILSSKNQQLSTLARERQLINFLNSNAHYDSSDNTLNDLGIDFKYSYFCSAIIKLMPTEKFYNTYNIIEYDTIKTGIFGSIKNLFEENYDLYLISSETDTSYILLNLPDASPKDNIARILDEVQEAFSYDKDYVTIKIAVGGIYCGSNGLLKSHSEAVKAISGLTSFNHVKTNTPAESYKHYILSISEENMIFNKLMMGDVDAVKDIINNILNKNINDGITELEMIQIYIQLLIIVFKVIRAKNLHQNLEEAYNFSIITKLFQQSLSENHELLLHYLDMLDKNAKNAYSKVDMQTITAYISNNFKRELSLAIISDMFRVTPKYLSKLFIENLGVNFSSYLANLRIEEAKSMLLHSNKNINDIYLEVGFNNRNTFLRTFKKLTGYTPSEYKKKNL